MSERLFKNMKSFHWLWLFVMFCVVGCRTKEESDTALLPPVEEDIRQLEQEARKLSNNEQIVFWKNQMQQIKHKQIPDVKAWMYYRLAGTYYNNGDLDSLKYYMRKAWDILEGEEASSEILTLLNYGEGNIATIEGNIHLENYYFNLAAQLIDSDSLMNLTAVQKAGIFMAAAQSDARLNQYAQAKAWNKKAIQNLQRDDKAPVHLQYRAYRQLANNYRLSSSGNLDSVHHYIQVIDTLWQRNQKSINPRFLYDEKAHYYQELQKFDSAIIYHHKIVKLDEEILKEESQHPPSHTNLLKDYINLSQNYLQLKKIKQAETFMRKAENFIKEDSKYLTDAEYLLFQEALVNYYYHTQQYEKAFEEYSLLSEKSKAVHENKYAQSIAEMATIYKLSANEKHIAGLNQQVLMTENKLAQNRLLLIISGLSALLAVAIVILLYFGRKQYKLKEEKEKVQLQKESMELQQQLLRTQMEPHFIFNTLAGLQSYIRMGEKEKALRYLNQFSRLLRNSLELSRENWVPLEDEIQTLEYYLSLQQIRYEDNFKYEIQKSYVEEDYLILIPPMLIQPFVENAILHGVANTAEKGKIDINLNLQDQSLVVHIIDNGPGIKTLKQNPDGKKKSLSTTISRERLAILAKEKGVEVQVNIMDRNEMDKRLTGTQVELVIPIERDF